MEFHDFRFFDRNPLMDTYGYHLILTILVDIDECIGNKYCPANSDCKNTEGSFTCPCRSGYEGEAKEGVAYDATIKIVPAVSDVKKCRTVCKSTEGCFAYTYWPDRKDCELQGNDFEDNEYETSKEYGDVSMSGIMAYPLCVGKRLRYVLTSY